MIDESGPKILAAVVAAAALILPVSARAQTRFPMELGGGLRLDGGTSFSRQAAIETGLGGARTVFVTHSRIERSIAPDIKIGVGLSDRLNVETAFSIGSPSLATTIEDDVEGVPGMTVKETIRRYLVEGGITFTAVRWQKRAWVPFASTGASYLRELHEGRTLLETGHAIYVGGGARYLLPMRAGSRVVPGVRFDFRLAVVDGGVAIGKGRHAVPTGGGVLFVRF